MQLFARGAVTRPGRGRDPPLRTGPPRAACPGRAVAHPRGVLGRSLAGGAPSVISPAGASIFGPCAARLRGWAVSGRAGQVWLSMPVTYQRVIADGPRTPGRRVRDWVRPGSRAFVDRANSSSMMRGNSGQPTFRVTTVPS